MAIMAVHHMAFAFGLLGNIVSFMVYLAPVPTFYRIFKRKSTEGFHSIPYIVALLSAMLYLYYGFLKANGMLLIIINTIGCTIEATYLAIYIVYATQGARIFTVKLLLLINGAAYGLIILFTFLFLKGSHRVPIVGWICAAFSVSVFAAPLSIIRLVVRTKSVQYMPFSLSFFLTISAIVWFFYGFLIKDFFIAFPNVLGFLLGILQMIIYTVYKDAKKDAVTELKLQELATDTIINIAENSKSDKQLEDDKSVAPSEVNV